MAHISFLILLACPLWAQFTAPGGGTTGPGSGGGAGGQFSIPSFAYTAGTYYLAPGGGLAASGTETLVQGLVGVTGAISNFTAKLSSAPGSATATFTWRKDNAGGGSPLDQLVTCSITGAATSCSDVTHSFNAAPGDLFDIKLVVTTATITTSMVLTWGLPGVAGPAGPPGSGVPYTGATSDLNLGSFQLSATNISAGTPGSPSLIDVTQGSCPAAASTGFDYTLCMESGALKQVSAAGAKSLVGGFTSPLTTAGDIYGHSTTDVRIPVGSNGQILTADSTQPVGVKWAAAPTGSSPFVTYIPQQTALSLNGKTSADGQIDLTGSSFTVPAATLTANSCLKVTATVLVAGTVGKSLRIWFGGNSSTIIFGFTHAWQATSSARLCMVNSLTTVSLITDSGTYGADGFASGGYSPVTLLDVSANSLVVKLTGAITSGTGAAGDTIQLNSLLIEVVK